jgi:MiaB-like tRNA modifying enzyme
MNHGEAREAAERLSTMGYDVEINRNADEADTVLLFTCDVISTTENRMWKRMDNIYSSGKNLMVAGCLASIAPDEIKKRFPTALIFQSMGLETLENSFKILDRKPDDKILTKEFIPSGERIDTIVPISSGCVGNCSYCITKIARGKVSSYNENDIIGRIQKGIERGRKEILLTSQDSAAYGMDGATKDLGSLLTLIDNGIKGDHRIRVGMMNPVLAVRKMESILNGFQYPNIFKFFHIPIQSGSDLVLENMRRGYTADGFRKMLSSIRSRFREATISTDLIVGFPGETNEDHRSSMEILEEISPEVLNITRFSIRPGTQAHSMKGQIKGWMKKERSREITRLHSRILAERLKDRLGHHPECLVTEVGKEGTMMARDINYTPIIIEAGRGILGSFIDIDTSRIGSTYLYSGKEWKIS